MSTCRQRVRYVVRGSKWHGGWMVFDMWERHQVASCGTRAEARSLAKNKNVLNNLKRSLANAVQLELLDD